MQRLTFDGTFKLAPAFVAGSLEIAFSVHDSPNLVAIKSVNVLDGSLKKLHPTLAAHQFDPSFSADGLYHCFAMSAASPQLVLVIQERKEKKEAMFRPRDARAVVRNPSIDRPGRRVIFGLSDHGGYQIASVNMEGQDLRKLAESAGMNCWPAVSPDGRRIAFGSSRDGSFQIYVMGADGSAVRRLTQGAGLKMRPAWSPDGKKIAFTGNRDGKYEIYFMNADGTNLHKLTTDSERDDYPAWHPDGKHLLTVSERGGKCDLYLHDLS